MEECLVPVTETWQRQGGGIELPHVAHRAQVHDPIAPTHDAETHDRLTYVTWADDMFLVARKAVEAKGMTSEVVDALREDRWLMPQESSGCGRPVDPWRSGSTAASYRTRTMFGVEKPL